MPLSKDPDTLRIPAFMRRRSLRAAAKKPLLLTALDVPKKIKRVAVIRKKKTRPRKVRTEVITPEVFFHEPVMQTPAPSKQRSRTPRIKKPKAKITFAEPLLDAGPVIVGEITHYYAKIKVGVIKIATYLSVGQSISYQTSAGNHVQLVGSMELDRTPIFKATKGNEIGIKLTREPVMGSSVVRVDE